MPICQLLCLGWIAMNTWNYLFNVDTNWIDIATYMSTVTKQFNHVDSSCKTLPPPREPSSVDIILWDSKSNGIGSPKKDGGQCPRRQEVD